MDDVERIFLTMINDHTPMAACIASLRMKMYHVSPVYDVHYNRRTPAPDHNLRVAVRGQTHKGEVYLGGGTC